MSQMGMQMPGRARASRPKLNVYTGLLLCAVAALAFATIFMFGAAASLAPGSGLMSAFQIHEEPRTPGALRFDN